MNTQYKQHGDCLVFIEDKLPKGLKKLGGSTLAIGEVTNHNHTFYDTLEEPVISSNAFTGYGSKNVCTYQADNGEIWAEILRPVFLKHHEHKPIMFKPGVYRIGIVREYDHVEKLARKVVD